MKWLLQGVGVDTVFGTKQQAQEYWQRLVSASNDLLEKPEQYNLKENDWRLELAQEIVNTTPNITALA